VGRGRMPLPVLATGTDGAEPEAVPVKRTFLLGTTAAVVAGVTGCAATHPHATTPRPHVYKPAPTIGIAAALPPSSATWPTYPRFSQHSCSGRPVEPGNRPGEQQYAPSYAPAPPAHPTPPSEIVRRFLARLGDRRYIHSITFPAYTNGRPLGDQLIAAVHAPRAHDATKSARLPPEFLTHGITGWEAALAFGALRDDFCAAGGPSLVGATREGGGLTADDLFAVEQRFPNPSPSAFRRRVALVGKRFGFGVVSLRLLRPEQIAPLLIVKTNRDRAAFARDVPTITELLNPRSNAGPKGAETFEGFYFAVEDARGPFVSTE
jgi:hypothetical protein